MWVHISLQLTGYDKSDNLEGILKSFIHFFGRHFLNAHFVPMVNDHDFTPAFSNLTKCFPASGEWLAGQLYSVYTAEWCPADRMSEIKSVPSFSSSNPVL